MKTKLAKLLVERRISLNEGFRDFEDIVEIVKVRAEEYGVTEQESAKDIVDYISEYYHLNNSESQISEEDSPIPEGMEVNWNSLEIDGIDKEDYPDFTDAYYSYGEYKDGTPISDEVLEYLTNNNTEKIQSDAMRIVNFGN